MNKAPWKDFRGADIFAGDFIVHPDGMTGLVVFFADREEPSDQWLVDYGNGSLSRLCLQIGDKGRAVTGRTADSGMRRS